MSVAVDVEGEPAAVGEVQPLLSTLNLELESAVPAHARAASA